MICLVAAAVVAVVKPCRVTAQGRGTRKEPTGLASQTYDYHLPIYTALINLSSSVFCRVVDPNLIHIKWLWSAAALGPLDENA